MGIEEARKFWEVFDSLTKTAQADYLNERFGELLFDISKDWEDYDTEIEELERIRKKEVDVNNEHNSIAEEWRVILSTPHFSIETKETDEGVVIDVFHRHGDLIDTYTYWNDDVIDKDREAREYKDNIVAYLENDENIDDYKAFRDWLKSSGLDIEFILYEDDAKHFYQIWNDYKEYVETKGDDQK